MPSVYNDNSVIEMFGLTYEQSLLMFSAQKLITEYDMGNTTSEKKSIIKDLWIREWEKGITTYLGNIDKSKDASLLSGDELQERFREEIEKSNNKTWYYIVCLELLEFIPYTALGGDDDNQFRTVKYNEKSCYGFIKNVILDQGYLTEEKIDRLDKTYTKSINQISGKTDSLVTKLLVVVAVGAIAAALTAIAAPEIAVALIGSTFEGLSGAALTNACLALIGGGALAIGGHGILGGVVTIAGGGALLGMAGSGTAVSVVSKILISTPDYTLTQAAKLETILKEVILNAQQDVVSAQKIIAQYKEQIDELNKKLTDMELEVEKNKQDIKNIKASIKYLKRSCQDMAIFASAYDEGLRAEA